MRLLRFLPSLLLAVPLAGQASPPPAYIQIFREEVKPGHGAMHAITEAGWPRAFAAAKTDNYYLAIVSTFGPTEAWFLEGHASIAEYEAASKAVEANAVLTRTLDRLSLEDAAHINGVRSLLARYRPELSNAATIETPTYHVWEISIFRVRPGKEASFAEGAMLYQGLVAKAKVTAPWAVYEIMAGMPGPTYLVMSPHKTLAELDPSVGVGAAIGKAMDDATMKKFGTLSEGFVSVETMVFNTSPAMSYLSDDWIKSDPKYWARKAPAPAPAAAAKPAAPKP